MNRKTLQNIAQGTEPLDAGNVQDLIELTKRFPYFSWPYAILARHYQQKQDFRTEALMHQAAMRIHSRTWLYGFTHHAEKKNTNLESTLNLDLVAAQSTQNESESLDFAVPSIEAPSSAEKAIDIPETVKEKESESIALPDLQETESEIIQESEPQQLKGTNPSKITPILQLVPHGDIEEPVKGSDVTIDRAEVTTEGHQETVLVSEVTMDGDEVTIEEAQETIEEAEITPAFTPVLTDLPTPEKSRTDISSPIPPAIEEKVHTVKDAIGITKSARFKTSTPPLDEISNKSKSNALLSERIVYDLERIYTPTEMAPEPMHSGKASNDFYAWLNGSQTDTHVPLFIPVNEDQNEELPKSIENQKSIIENFLLTKPSISRPKQEFFKPEKAQKKGEKLSGKIVTETLAQIYLKQDNPDKAIWAYEQLQLKFPEKKTYFANLITEIKKEQNKS